MKSKTERVFLWDKKIHLLNCNQIRFPIASRLLSGIPHLTFGDHELSSKLHANGKVVCRRNNWCLWYEFIVLSTVSSKLCNVTETLIRGTLVNMIMNSEKKQWLWLYEIEKLFHAVSGTYTPRFRMSSIIIESIEMVTEII